MEDDHPAITSLYRATYGMLLFAIPHRGLLVSDIQQMLAGDKSHPRERLLQQISSQSDLLIHQLADFKNLIRDRKVVSFYETEQTRQLVFVRIGLGLRQGYGLTIAIGLGSRTMGTHGGFHHDGGCRLGASPASRPCGGQGAAACGPLEDRQVRHAQRGRVSNGAR